MIQTMADFTPLAIMVVGMGQVGVVAWGVYVMRKAAQERSEQMEPMQQALLEAARGIRELLDRDRRQG